MVWAEIVLQSSSRTPVGSFSVLGTQNLQDTVTSLILHVLYGFMSADMEGQRSVLMFAKNCFVTQAVMVKDGHELTKSFTHCATDDLRNIGNNIPFLFQTLYMRTSLT